VLGPLADQGLWIALVGGLLLLVGAKVGALAPAAGRAGAVAAVLAASGILCFQGRGEPRSERAGQALTLAWGGFSVLLGLAVLGIGRPWTGGAAAALLAVVVLLHRGRLGEVLGRLGLGLYALYGALGYLSDLLSYSRLVALGLGSGTVAMVVNTMAALALDVPAAGLFLGALVFVVGHLFNLAIALLGAFVHSSRLQYVEFFTKFYGAGGRAYAPFRLAPRHVTIVDGGPRAGAAAGG
jgi:vacuolar-type H+-ATPase subunit I/STV1